MVDIAKITSLATLANEIAELLVFVASSIIVIWKMAKAIKDKDKAIRIILAICEALLLVLCSLLIIFYGPSPYIAGIYLIVWIIETYLFMSNPKQTSRFSIFMFVLISCICSSMMIFVILASMMSEITISITKMVDILSNLENH
jgi:hypothetical protein